VAKETIDGLGEVIIKIDSWKQEKIDAVVDAVQVSQNAVVKEARRLVPVITGNLQSSIQAGRVIIGHNSADGEIIAGMEYASFVEFGSYNVRTGKRNRPKPYLRPAILSKRNFFRKQLRNALAT